MNVQLAFLLMSTLALSVMAMEEGKLKAQQQLQKNELNGVQHMEGENRRKKFLNIFTTVRFRNNACSGTDGNNGTCYTSAECSQKGGTSKGSCAAGYGVCCTFVLGCGAQSSQNCTYFVSSTTPTAGSCTLTICPCNSNICQLRLDFTSFVLTGPSTKSTSDVKLLNGVVSPGGVNSASTASECLTDTFTATSDTGCSPPTICGVNTGQHMYLHADSGCNTLNFNLGSTGIFATIPTTRSWNIKITQYACDYNNLAPDCCTQYFYGSTVNNIMSYNYNGGTGYQLADQNQNICIRQEMNICKICYTAAAIDFQLSGKTAGGQVSSCCSYGPTGGAIKSKGTNGFDCIVIPGAVKTKATNTKIPVSRFCGRSDGLVTTNSLTKPTTICSVTTPFNIVFRSDHYEFLGDAQNTAGSKGFMITYIEMSC